jgi:membrane-bound lytic murein transglycosylase B
VADWAARGVRTLDGNALPAVAGRAAIVLPQGWQGPAFMVFDNFDVVMDWNRSQNYALSVAQLAHQLAGGATLTWRQEGEADVLSTARLKALQTALNELGFDAGTPDGLPGPRTQMALRRYQARHGLPADGYPSPGMLTHIEQNHAAAVAAGSLVRPAPAFAESDGPP